MELRKKMKMKTRTMSLFRFLDQNNELWFSQFFFIIWFISWLEEGFFLKYEFLKQSIAPIFNVKYKKTSIPCNSRNNTVGTIAIISIYVLSSSPPFFPSIIHIVSNETHVLFYTFRVCVTYDWPGFHSSFVNFVSLHVHACMEHSSCVCAMEKLNICKKKMKKKQKTVDIKRIHGRSFDLIIIRF